MDCVRGQPSSRSSVASVVPNAQPICLSAQCSASVLCAASVVCITCPDGQHDLPSGLHHWSRWSADSFLISLTLLHYMMRPTDPPNLPYV